MGTFKILRANSLSNFEVWEEMRQIKIDDYISSSKIYWLFDDYTI
jgi:hypothetical protein